MAGSLVENNPKHFQRVLKSIYLETTDKIAKLDTLSLNQTKWLAMMKMETEDYIEETWDYYYILTDKGIELWNRELDS